MPSRLACIFVAEDNLDGRVMLQNMFNFKRDFHLAPVDIAPIRLHKADSKWIQEYEETNNPTFMEWYWRGVDCDDNPQYEYLIDRVVKLKNIEDREIIISNI